MTASLLLLAACKPDGQEETLVQSIEVTPGTVICTDLTEEDGHGSLPVPLSLLSCIEVDDYMVYRVMDGSTSTTTKTSAVSTIAVMKLRFK